MNRHPGPKKPTAKALSMCELAEMLPDERAAIARLAPILWPDGPVCPHCGAARAHGKAA